MTYFTTSSDSEVTEDALLNHRVRILQPANGYRVAIDTVLLAAAVEAQSGARVLELGTGVGAVALCLLVRCRDITITGWERDPNLARLAIANSALNTVTDRFHIEQHDVLEKSNLREGSFDHVISNPPYHGAGTPSPNLCKTQATREVDLFNWVATGAHVLNYGGSFTLLYRADRLPQLLAAMRGRFGSFRLRAIRPYEDRPASRVLLRAYKGACEGLSLMPDLVLHTSSGGFTSVVEAILRDVADLPL